MKRLITLLALVACLTGSALADIETPVQGANREYEMHGPAGNVNQPVIENPVEGAYREFETHGPADSDPWILGWLWILLV